MVSAAPLVYSAAGGLVLLRRTLPVLAALAPAAGGVRLRRCALLGACLARLGLLVWLLLGPAALSFCLLATDREATGRAGGRGSRLLDCGAGLVAMLEACTAADVGSTSAEAGSTGAACGLTLPALAVLPLPPVATLPPLSPSPGGLKKVTTLSGIFCALMAGSWAICICSNVLPGTICTTLKRSGAMPSR
jgi:hypothetical protein